MLLQINARFLKFKRARISFSTQRELTKIYEAKDGEVTKKKNGFDENLREANRVEAKCKKKRRKEGIPFKKKTKRIK